jgi:ectoine hydroxylase-related dioxygenase (phytanoyl-CoA dioxygenase family)
MPTDADEMNERGWCVLEPPIAPALVGALKQELDLAYESCRALQVANGLPRTEGTAHHLVCFGGAFLTLLEQFAAHPFIESFFGGKYILNTYGAVLNEPGTSAYVGNVHRDLRSHSGGLRLMMQLIVMLDPFTDDNGATYLLRGSHRRAEPPAADEFFAHADRAIGPAGRVVAFDSNLWHAAGVNRSQARRRGLTIAFTRPFMKPQLDYPRALGYAAADAMSPALRQVLGYNARVPASLEEWYQPAERRMYQRDQG